MSKSLARKYAELFDKKPDDYEYHTQLFYCFSHGVALQDLEAMDDAEIEDLIKEWEEQKK